MFYSDPADRIVAVTASDSTDLTGARGLLVGGAGDVAVRMINAPDTTVTMTGIVAGAILPLRVTRVMAATTATNITALY
jgi:hypothetical protein